MGSPTQQRGFDYESLALQFLTAKGLVLVARQWRCRFGEIDLIMREGATLVFIEVRQRGSAAFGGALASITPTKLAKLTRTAELFIAESKFSGNCRIDAVLIGRDGQPEWVQAIGSA
jgi:putative endonuclease